MAFVRLTSDKYSSVKSLLMGEEAVFLPSPLSILEGSIDGVVFVDHADNPSCAAIMSPNLIGGRLVGAATEPAFVNGFVETMRQRFTSEHGTVKAPFVFYSTVSETWDSALFEVFGYRIFRTDRTQFRFHRDAFERLPVGQVADEVNVCVRRIDPDVTSAFPELTRNIEGLWGSVERFLHYGCGWVAISEDGRFVGKCYSAFVGGGSAELGIDVDKSLRGSGVGFCLAQRFIQDCLKMDITPNWTCDTLNKASVNLAKKLGFEYERPYYLFTAPFANAYHEPGRTDL
ncbi:GNAT family N-acetyltransferase [Alicyclobacillus acidiphilus]|uniref:GNAT family N-acetyltransferase n=1 Tax=Alicyclobacillus acidiphilus TaxID=182455 RepID=UPI00082B0E74|nr:GNAT family N-acetyltransferase [Alicyclobacillus acidiphilus]